MRTITARCLLLAVAAASAAAPVGAGQIDTATFNTLRRGMSEGEVMARAGEPDRVSQPGEVSTVREFRDVTPRGDGGVNVDVRREVDFPVVQRWHYIPDSTEHDPHLTVIVFRRGEVWELERTKIFNRANLPEPPVVPDAPAARAVPSDYDILQRRYERHLKAAEQYERTRERLLEHGARNRATAGAPQPQIYRSVDKEGTAYFGDSPAETANSTGDANPRSETSR